MDELLPFLRWVRLAMLAALLVILTGCLAPGGQSASVPVVANASPEAMSVLTDSPSAPATADPALTRTPPPEDSPSATLPSTSLGTGGTGGNGGAGGTSIVELPAVSTAEPPAETASATPVAELPVAPVEGARAPDFTLIDLNGEEVSLSDLRGQPVLLNFWTTW